MRAMPAPPTARRRCRPATPGGGLAAALLLALAGCTGGSEPDPDLAGLSAPELIQVTADEMAELETVRLTVTVDSEQLGLPLRRLEGQVTRGGDAAGTALMEQFGQLLEVEFVVVGDDFYFQLLGAWQHLSRRDAVALALDPAVILDPDRGVADLLRTATEPAIVATPDASASGMYEVAAAVDAERASALVPGVPGVLEGLTATLFIDPQRPLLRQVVFDLVGGGTVTVELSDFDADADIRAP
jgi:lipoprotein LprG